jgi:hypothetical protein
MLHDRVSRSARRTGRGEPRNTTAIFTVAAADAPDLLNQLLLVHQRAEEERRHEPRSAEGKTVDESERKRMLSAVRATVRQSSERFTD